MATTPGLGLTLPEIGEATAATLQLFLVWVEAISLGKLKDHDQNTPPGSPAEGDLYATGAAATGDWSGNNEKFALYYNGGWNFLDIPDSTGPYTSEEGSGASGLRVADF